MLGVFVTIRDDDGVHEENLVEECESYEEAESLCDATVDMMLGASRARERDSEEAGELPVPEWDFEIPESL